MPQKLTLADARQSLTGHVAHKGAELRAKYGPEIGWAQLEQILRDSDFVRYPCELAFDASSLLDGECAHPTQNGAAPEEGFIMQVHPFFSVMPAKVPFLVLYQLVLVNYGEFASSDDAETFGAAALGISRDEYYNELCALADLIGDGPDAESHAGPHPDEPHECGCGSGGCGCHS